MKEFQSNFESADLLQEAKLVNYLTAHDIPTARFIETIDGRLFFEYANHLICLEEYIDGTTYGYYNFPKEIMPEVARTLAKLHNCLEGYELPADLGKEWLESFSVENELAKYSRLIEVLEEHKEDKNYDRIKADFIYRQQLVLKGKEYIKYFDGITYKATHGDFQGCQLICEDMHIKGVVDFSSAGTLPAVWEIMRSYMHTNADCRSKASLDVADFAEYVREYMMYSTLTRKDIEAMPYVYLFKMMRSTYGYPQYLLTDSDDREGLLEYGIWKTRILKEVESKAELIVRELNYGRC